MSITDPIVEQVKEMFDQRSKLGIKKYGKTLAESDLSLKEWLQHALEEHMDAILYIQKAITELDK